tara:strand:+ start:815 stop:1921 length:1107 start_codon:yes stop_codon:yes gene_type:complete
MDFIIFDDIYRDKNVLITGNTGFKGSWLSIWLNRLGANVYGISNDIPTNPSLYKESSLKSKINFNSCDIRNLDKIKSLINDIKPDFIFHLAAQPIVSESYKNPIETIETNVIGTANILESLRFINFDCNCIIITSDKCYENIEQVWGYKENDYLGGKDIYSGSKASAEIIFKSYYHSFFKNNKNVKLASVRAGNVIGGGDWADNRIVPDCILSWYNKKSVEIRSPESTRPWQHVLEPLSGYLLLGSKLVKQNSLSGSSFNFGPQSETSKTVQELIYDLSEIWNLKFNPCIINKPKDAFHEAGLLKLNCDKALFEINWTPNLEYQDLINFTSSWYYDFYYSKFNSYLYTKNQIISYEKIAFKNKKPWIK